MTLSGLEIKKAMMNKDIIIEPYNESQLNPNSYNLKLDRKLLIYDISPDEYLDMKKENHVKELYIPDDGLILYPGVLYLGKTVEYTETHKYLPCLDGRSSIGRFGITIHVTAGFGDVGFAGNWTLEIAVIHPIKVYPNIEICQIYYNEINGEVEEYHGKYQHSRDASPSKLYQEF